MQVSLGPCGFFYLTFFPYLLSLIFNYLSCNKFQNTWMAIRTKSRTLKGHWGVGSHGTALFTGAICKQP